MNMKKSLKAISLLLLAAMVWSCGSQAKQEEVTETTTKIEDDKIIVYQMFTRLFGNTNTNNKKWGTLEENGVGKLNDVSDKALKELKDLGTTHVWFTGVIEHGVCTDYTEFGIPLDDADVVKGRAGSPYAIKDYYDINPDLAKEVPNRMKEFEALIKRVHDNGMEVVVDFVPNHVARRYFSDAKPEGVEDLGASDDVTKGFDMNNNFYYIEGKPFKAPKGYEPLGGQPFPTSDGKFDENPAKVSGNGAVTDQPSVNDWFETVRLNYGVNHIADGSKHFGNKTTDIPSTWKKMTDILLFWASKGVDAFRCDMAEMVPVEFWHYGIAEVKKQYPDIRFIAEIYNPKEYRNYIHDGGFDYLYDKVGVYDTLRAVMEDRVGSSALNITQTHEDIKDIRGNMLNFLENHDEQRLASEFFAKDARMGIPGMTVSATLHTGPVMVYFGQEVGEPGKGDSGFNGDDGRTTIFDYWGVPEHQKWVNGGKFDGGQLSAEQKSLREFYKNLLHLCRSEEAVRVGELYDLQPANADNKEFDADRAYAFLRYTDNQKIMVVANFTSAEKTVKVQVPAEAIQAAKLSKTGKAKDLLFGNVAVDYNLEEGVELTLPAFGAVVLELK